jgi:DNA-binding transcriptional regulator YiaG
MTKAGKEIIAGAEQALAYLKGDKTQGRVHKIRARHINVKAIREKLNMTQEVFSETFAIPVSTYTGGPGQGLPHRHREKPRCGEEGS